MAVRKKQAKKKPAKKAKANKKSPKKTAKKTVKKGAKKTAKKATVKEKTAEILVDQSFRTGCQTLDFSQDNGLLAVSTWDKKVHVWDIENHEWRWRQKEHTGPCHCAKVSPDSRFVASCGPRKEGRKEAGSEILLWDVARGRVIGRIDLIEDVTADANDLAYSWDGKYVACGLRGEDSGAIAIIDVTSQRIVTYESGNYDYSPVPTFSPDGKSIAVFVDDHLEMWNLRPWKTLYSTDAAGDAETVVFSEDGSLIYAGSEIPSGVSIIEAKTGRVRDVILKGIDRSKRLKSLHLGPERITAAYYPNCAIGVNLKTLAINYRVMLPTECDEGDDIAISSDGSLLAGISEDRLRIWALPE